MKAGGVQSGPIGFEISAKFAWNYLSEPVEHRFFTVPINMRDGELLMSERVDAWLAAACADASGAACRS